MTKIDAIKRLACVIEDMSLHGMRFKMCVGKSNTAAERQKAVDEWDATCHILHDTLIDLLEPNEEQAEAMKDELKDSKSYFARSFANQ
jgi:hypothetical protein